MLNLEELSPKQRRVLRARRRVGKKPAQENIVQNQIEAVDDSILKNKNLANEVKKNERGKNLSARNGRQVKFEQSPLGLDDIKPKKRTKIQFDEDDARTDASSKPTVRPRVTPFSKKICWLQFSLLRNLLRLQGI